ncbi:hypothetical protein [Nocardioides piscis]|nr:hypothetical protein [Nocardioides piscis]
MGSQALIAIATSRDDGGRRALRLHDGMLAWRLADRPVSVEATG